ncbi:calcium/sodium antiporter [Candidatus Peregrinibacteria bacterium]|nr:calcium/sodium antiporter [Candidatus Peregrinibacteria bacterium]
MEVGQWIALFIVSLAVLLQAAKYFTETAERIGIHFKIPPFIIGVTIVAFGTSLPEIATSIIAVVQGESAIVIGNVTGSNLANILLVLSITAIVAGHLKVSKDIVKIDLPLLLGSTILLYLTTLDGKFNYVEGIISMLALITYIFYNISSRRNVGRSGLKDFKALKKEEKKKIKKDHLHIKYPLILILAGAFLYFAANFTIQSVVELSKIFNIGTDIIAVSAIAIGTSLPELAVSVIAARNGKADIAIGNVTGSNIFNALAVMGVPSFIGTLEIPVEFTSFTIPLLLLVTILYVFSTMDREISKWEGFTFLLIFVVFMGKTFNLI